MMLVLDSAPEGLEGSRLDGHDGMKIRGLKIQALRPGKRPSRNFKQLLGATRGVQ